MVVNDNEGYTCGWNHDIMRYVSQEPRPDFEHSDCGYAGEDRFGSSHPGGFNISLCDGSVRFLQYSISLDVFRRLGDRQDGQAVEVP